MSKRDAYIAKIKLQLDELNQNMGKLEAKVHEAREDARASYAEEISKLRQHSKLAVDKLNEMMTASESSWEHMVVDMEKVRDAFTRSFHYFKSQL